MYWKTTNALVVLMITSLAEHKHCSLVDAVAVVCGWIARYCLLWNRDQVPPAESSVYSSTAAAGTAPKLNFCCTLEAVHQYGTRYQVRSNCESSTNWKPSAQDDCSQSKCMTMFFCGERLSGAVRAGSRAPSSLSLTALSLALRLVVVRALATSKAGNAGRQRTAWLVASGSCGYSTTTTSR